MADFATNSTTVSGFSARFHEWVEEFKASRQRRAKYHQTCRELNAMTNRELSDIRVHRSDIDRIARYHLDQT